MQYIAAIQRYRLHHLLAWIILLGLWYFFRYEDYSTPQLAFRITLLKVADLALMVYMTNYLLIPYLLYKKQYVLFGVVFLLLVCSCSYLKMWLEARLMHNADAFGLLTHVKSRLYDNVIPHLLLVSTGAAFKLVLDYAHAQQRIGQMVREHAAAELNFLKSQINPHFVFNSLNAVYFLIDRQNAAARDALHKFSGMLRYQLYECNGQQIPVEKEIAYLKDYIDMQRLRHDAHCHISFTCAPAVNGFTIAPLLLIPFVENAFKHLSHNNELNEVVIDVQQANGNLQFSVANTTEAAPGNAQTAGGIGLKNVRRRLELLYPGKHALHIQHAANRFTILLSLHMEQVKHNLP
ncbi:sensor histidine kinase [Deminuibacter soli]|uniref:Signal transduction histidine kinase internal region domain-containing protein n=1 Tax=Deminuibacter soli TaxID=2291815 RepID=A0A3E1NK69_9BACT|nr:histidine kinase [Deminuibacter soli]RFM28313.1 hypothetical protein DXN05_12440 [Deminuibacter soli]